MANPIAYASYQALADSYAELAPNKDYNAHYDRPAILALLDDLRGQNVLDAGCGPGIYTELLLQRSARVTGIDISERMLFHARQRNGDRARFLKADLEEPLTAFQNAEFDGILSALAITYVKDLAALFREFLRLIKPQGWLVFSTEHPFFAHGYFKIDNYFETQPVSCLWRGFNNTPIEMPGYYHSLGCICDGLTSNGFYIERLLEAKPTLEFQKQDPQGYEKRLKFPAFIHIKARRKG
ncbi:MAG: class I SAM-dependent methyltransferase [Phycisphaerae bacterium]